MDYALEWNGYFIYKNPDGEDVMILTTNPEIKELRAAPAVWLRKRSQSIEQPEMQVQGLFRILLLPLFVCYPRIAFGSPSFFVHYPHISCGHSLAFFVYYLPNHIGAFPCSYLSIIPDLMRCFFKSTFS